MAETITRGAFAFGPYRYAEPFMGQLPKGREPTLDERRVNWAVKDIQQHLLKQGFDPKRTDGLFTNSTAVAVRRFQRSHDLRPFDEQVFWGECRVLFTTPVRSKAGFYEVPFTFLWGEIMQESGFDPAAVGYVNENDHGLVQINMESHPSVREQDAFNVDFAIDWAAQRMRAAFERFQDNPDVAWSCAIANHNSPAKALRWYETGSPPLDEGETAPGQIERYVANIMSHWDRFGS